MVVDLASMAMETPAAVSIDFDDDGTEWVEFDLSRMKEDEFYPFAYHGELWTVKRCHKTVDIMKLVDC